MKRTGIKKVILSVSLLLITLLNSAIATSESNNVTTQSISPQRQQELTHLLKQDCGSCHGMTLKGGLGPALLPENLVDKPDHVLVGVIKYGRETLAMPGWDGILNTAEIEWLVAQLKQGNFVEPNREKK
jgi:cytochrome c55X